MSVDASEALLRWFAVDKRRLPWRAESGEKPDPYRVWLSEVMLQQTTVAHATRYFEFFTRRWPTIEALAGAAEGDVMAAWAGLGYYARARNLIACARKVAGDLGGRFPDSEDGLRTLPGIGRYTAPPSPRSVRAAAVVVDSNGRARRRSALRPGNPAAGREGANLPPRRFDHPRREGWGLRAGDDGPRRHDLHAPLARLRPLPPRLALRGPRSGAPERSGQGRRRPKPRRQGVAYWLEHDGHVLLIRRPPWVARRHAGSAHRQRGAPAQVEWREAGSVDHVFTHFALTMRLLCADADRIPDGTWWPIDRLNEAGLPTLFARLAARGAEWRQAA